MARIDYLREQVARAEHLAKAILDQQTAQRLQAFAAECRAELQVLSLRTAAQGSASYQLHRRIGDHTKVDPADQCRAARFGNTDRVVRLPQRADV